MSVEFDNIFRSTNTFQKARKEYECARCGKLITRGEMCAKHYERNLWEPLDKPLFIHECLNCANLEK